MKRIILFILASIIINGCVFNNDAEVVIESVTNNNTAVFVVNNTSDTVLVYLTMGSDTNYVTNVNGVFGITGTGLQGSFNLNPHDTVNYTSPIGKGFDGNLSFGTPPNNCPDTVAFPMGINLFEYALNNNFPSVVNAQETIDISCVSGANSYITCNLYSRFTWNASSSFTNVTTFKNSSVYDNTGLVGVYPFGCDTCTGSKAPPICPNQKKFAQPQSQSICNVQRNASSNGGQVVVVYNGVIKGEILK